MIPIYFGPSEQPLFGVYHPAEGDRASSHAVLLCYPLGQEYQRTHRLFRQLGTLLSEAGLSVLRFDYVGTGDSAGETGEGTPEQWRDNIKTAAHELRDLASPAQISVVGLRLGAALAASVGTLDRDFNTLVLWDPVVSGAAYLASLRAMHLDVLREEYPGGAWTTEADRVGEALGIHLSQRMRAELEQIDLLALPRYPGKRVVVIASEERGSYTALCRRLAKLGREYAYVHVLDGGDWDDRLRHEVLVSQPSVVRRITEILATSDD